MVEEDDKPSGRKTVFGVEELQVQWTCKETTAATRYQVNQFGSDNSWCEPEAVLTQLLPGTLCTAEAGDPYFTTKDSLPPC